MAKNGVIFGLVLAILLICLWLYRTYGTSDLNVTPEAKREIEGAKRR